MMLTFELQKDSESLEIFFDAEGRDRLIELISNCNKSGDHFHLFLGDIGSGFEKVVEPLSKQGKILPYICAWIVDRGLDRSDIERQPEE